MFHYSMTVEGVRANSEREAKDLADAMDGEHDINDSHYDSEAKETHDDENE